MAEQRKACPFCDGDVFRRASSDYECLNCDAVLFPSDVLLKEAK